jgi:hypothetical protein
MRVGAGSVLALLVLSILVEAFHDVQNSPAALSAVAAAKQQQQTDVATEPEARAACIPCHAYPPPDVLPRAAWRDEIARMSLIRSNLPQPTGPRGMSARMMVLPSDFTRVLRYYEARAPDRLPAPAPWPAANALTFVKRPMNPANAPDRPFISNVRLLDTDGDGRLELLATDMLGFVMRGRPFESSPTLDVIALLSNPSRWPEGFLRCRSG